MISQESNSRIKKFIANNQLAEALNELEKGGIDVHILRGRLKRLNEKIHLRTETPDYYDRTNNQLSQDILKAIDQSQSTSFSNTKPHGSHKAKDQSPTYYERLLRTFKNNKWIAWLLIVLGILKGALDFGLIDYLKPKSSIQSYIITGWIKDSLNHPVKGATVQILNVTSSVTTSDSDGKFITSIDLERTTNLNLRYTHPSYDTLYQTSPADITNDTIQIRDIILQTKNFGIKQKETETPKVGPATSNAVTTTQNTFAILFRNSIWQNCVLVNKLENHQLTFTDHQNPKYKIEIKFPDGAIYPHRDNYMYNKAEPIITINGKRCVLPKFKLFRKSDPETLPKLESFLKQQINAHLNSPEILDEILKQL